MAPEATTQRHMPQTNDLKLHADLHVLNRVDAFGVGGLLLELVH